MDDAAEPESSSSASSSSSGSKAGSQTDRNQTDQSSGRQVSSSGVKSESDDDDNDSQAPSMNSGGSAQSEVMSDNASRSNSDEPTQEEPEEDDRDSDDSGDSDGDPFIGNNSGTDDSASASESDDDSPSSSCPLYVVVPPDPVVNTNPAHQESVSSNQPASNQPGDEGDSSDSSTAYGFPPKLKIVVDSDLEDILAEKPAPPNPSEGTKTRAKKNNPKNLNTGKLAPALAVLAKKSSSTTVALQDIPMLIQKPKAPSEETHFPPKTVRRVISYITNSHDIRVSHSCVNAIAVALESFIQEFSKEAFRYAQRKKRNIIRYNDIVHVGNHYANLYFLQNFLPMQQPAAYVVRNILEDTGAGSGRIQNGEPDVTESVKLNGMQKRPNEAIEKNVEVPRPPNMTAQSASALHLAKSWDNDPKLKKWRSMVYHSGKSKGKPK